MDASAELFLRATDCVERTIRLRDLETWLAPRLRYFLTNPENPPGQLAGLIELCLAEFHDGIRTERSVRTRLSRFLANAPIRYISYSDKPEQLVTATSSSVTISLQWSPVWSSEPQVVYG